jgi:hypothetical protein
MRDIMVYEDVTPCHRPPRGTRTEKGERIAEKGAKIRMPAQNPYRSRARPSYEIKLLRSG